MEEIKVTLSANAGIGIDAAGKKIWVDALHADAEAGFSILDPGAQQWVLSSAEFAPPDLVVYTHCHGDHYSRSLTCEAMKKWPDAKVILPRQDFGEQILLSEQRHVMDLGEIRLEFFRLPHEGQQYADVPLYGMLLSLPGGNILLPGDCAVASPVLKDAIGDRKIDVAIVDFPWITLRKGQQFLEEHIRPNHVLAYHLPFAEDDRNGYRGSAQRAAQQLSGWDIRLLQDPKQSEEINI